MYHKMQDNAVSAEKYMWLKQDTNNSVKTTENILLNLAGTCI